MSEQYQDNWDAKLCPFCGGEAEMREWDAMINAMREAVREARQALTEIAELTSDQTSAIKALAGDKT